MGGGQLIACVRQNTDHDDLCAVRSYGNADDFMRLVMRELLGGAAGAAEWERSWQDKAASYNATRTPTTKTRGDIFVKKW